MQMVMNNLAIGGIIATDETVAIYGGFELHRFKSLHRELVSVVHKASNMCVDIDKNISPERIIDAIKVLKKFDA